MYYKIEQLKAMLKAEQDQKENEKYGAHLNHWSGKAKPIQIDEQALKCLITHYERRMKKGKENSKNGNSK